MESRTPTQTAWLGLAFLLLTILLIGGGWLAWRGAARSTPPSPVPADPTSSEIPPNASAPEMIDGVPWGWPLTPDGAVAAAATAVAATGQPDAVFDASRFEAVAGVVFTPEQAGVQVREVEAARTQFELSAWADQPASRRTYFFAPLAVRLASYDAQRPRATVEVWAMTLIGVGDSGGALFTTSTVHLAASPSGNTWQVSRMESEQGPTPLVTDIASPPGRTRMLLRDSAPVLPLPLGSWG